nr:response regulator [Paracoccus sp. PAMC 22219]
MSRHLLIVEDDAALATTLMESFARRGYQVSHAGSTEEGIDLAQGQPFDLALVDLKLPGRSGLECVQALAALDPAPRIVVLTGFASIATAVEAIKLGAAHYLAKPATTSEIEAAFARDSGDPSVAVAARRTSCARRNGKRSRRRCATAISTYPRPRDGWACTDGPWRASWPRNTSAEVGGRAGGSNRRCRGLPGSVP